MGRPITNRSNFLDDSSWKVLVSAAEISSFKYSQISKEEFISEGWYQVIRYKRTADENSLKRSCLQSMRRYAAKCWIKSKGEHSFGEDIELFPDEKEINNLEEIEVLKSLDILNSMDRRMIQLRFLSELSWDEISKRMDIPAATLILRCKKALKQLRKNISKFS